MSHGIRTMSDLRDRCVIDDETGCWVWPTERKRTSTLLRLAGGHPISLGRAVYILRYARNPPAGRGWVRSCGNTRCANPEHGRAGTRAQMVASWKRPDTPAELIQRAARHRALSVEAMDEVMLSDEPARVLAERFGVHRDTINAIRRGQRLTRLAPGASVFNWRPATPASE